MTVKVDVPRGRLVDGKLPEQSGDVERRSKLDRIERSVGDLCASLGVFEALKAGELSQADLMGETGKAQAAVSRWLAVLMQDGWVACRPQKPRQLYRLTERGRAAYAVLDALVELFPEADPGRAIHAVRCLSSSTRLRLADILRAGGMNVSRLAAASGVIQVNVSTALNFMEFMGVVERTRRGHSVVNSLTERGRRFLEILEEFAAA